MATGGRKKVTSFDVAERAGVSRSMVSRAFTEGSEISAESRAKIQAVARELGYRVNHMARSLQTRNSGLVGIVASALDTPLRAQQVKVAARECVQRGYRPILMIADHPDEVAQLVTMLFNYNVAGIIITSAEPSSEIISEANDLAIPIVLVNRESDVEGPDLVHSNSQQGGKLAYDMLTRSGGKRFAVVQPETPAFSVTGRANAFRAQCESNGAEVQVYHASALSYQAGYDVAGELGMAVADLDGIFCSTDLVAFGVLDRLRSDWNIKVPEQIEIVGFDDIEQSSWASYQLTTIRQDVDAQSRAAVELMIERIENPHRESRQVLQTVTPIFRNTTKKLHD